MTAWDSLREFGKAPCNDGDPLAILEEKTSGIPIDLQLLKEGWETCQNTKHRQQLEPYIATLKRDLHSFCYALMRDGIWKGMKLEVDPCSNYIEVLIVSHGTLLHELTG